MKRIILILCATSALYAQNGGGAPKKNFNFAALNWRHQPFDMLFGVDVALGMTPNIGNVFGAGDELPSGNYAMALDAGASYDFYLLHWLSMSASVYFRPELYLLLDSALVTDKKFTDLAAAPFYLSVPIMVHINMPKADWIYMGAGIGVNVPLFNMSSEGIKGDSFVSAPVDLGVDWTRPGWEYGWRLFFRANFEFHEDGIAVPLELVWQIKNWRIGG